MFAAAAKKGGVDGVPQAVGKEFAAADKGGKLPARKRRLRDNYDHPSSRK